MPCAAVTRRGFSSYNGCVRQRTLAYLVAVVAVLIALGIRWAVNPWLADRVPFITLFGAVIVAAWYGGWGPALAAAVLGWIGAELAFIEPIGGISLRGRAQGIEAGAYAPPRRASSASAPSCRTPPPACSSRTRRGATCS
jgi:hypothetical protein